MRTPTRIGAFAAAAPLLLLGLPGCYAGEPGGKPSKVVTVTSKPREKLPTLTKAAAAVRLPDAFGSCKADAPERAQGETLRTREYTCANAAGENVAMQVFLEKSGFDRWEQGLVRLKNYAGFECGRSRTDYSCGIPLTDAVIHATSAGNLRPALLVQYFEQLTPLISGAPAASGATTPAPAPEPGDTTAVPLPEDSSTAPAESAPAPAEPSP